MNSAPAKTKSVLCSTLTYLLIALLATPVVFARSALQSTETTKAPLTYQEQIMFREANAVYEQVKETASEQKKQGAENRCLESAERKSRRQALRMHTVFQRTRSKIARAEAEVKQLLDSAQPMLANATGSQADAVKILQQVDRSALRFRNRVMPVYEGAFEEMKKLVVLNLSISEHLDSRECVNTGTAARDNKKVGRKLVAYTKSYQAQKAATEKQLKLVEGLQKKLRAYLAQSGIKVNDIPSVTGGESVMPGPLEKIALERKKREAALAAKKRDRIDLIQRKREAAADDRYREELASPRPFRDPDVHVNTRPVRQKRRAAAGECMSGDVYDTARSQYACLSSLNPRQMTMKQLTTYFRLKKSAGESTGASRIPRLRPREEPARVSPPQTRGRLVNLERLRRDHGGERAPAQRSYSPSRLNNDRGTPGLVRGPASFRKDSLNQYIYEMLDRVGKNVVNSNPRDITKYCRNYRRLDYNQRRSVWTHIIATMSKFESNQNPEVGYTEKSGARSRGLLQIGYGRHLSVYRCNVSYASQLHDERKNLFCGIRILDHWLKRHDQFSDHKGAYTTRRGCSDYHWQGGAKFWSVLRTKITFRSSGGCHVWRDNTAKYNKVRRLASQHPLCRGMGN